MPLDTEGCSEGRQEKLNNITTGDAVDTNSDALDAVDTVLDTVDTAFDAADTAIDAVDTASDVVDTAIDAVEHSAELAALLLDQADIAEAPQEKSTTGATADTASDAAELSSGLATLLLDSASSAAYATADVSAAELVTVDKGECHAAVSHQTAHCLMQSALLHQDLASLQ